MASGQEQGLILLDAQGRVRAAEPAALRHLGLDAQATELPPALAIAVELARSELGAAPAQRRLPLPADSGYEAVLLATGDAQLSLLLRPATAPAGGNADAGSHAGAEDPTALRAALEASQQELEQFAYTVSHDLQAPLRTLMSFAQLLKADCGDDLSEDASQYLAFIDRGAQQMQGLIQGLLLYSRAGRFDTDYGATELEPIWQQVRAQQKKAIEASQAQVESAPLPSWPVAPDGLQMLLAALLDNALKYPAEGEPPRVELRATIEGDTLQLEMRDHGRGLPEDLREAAFEPFRRVHSDAGLPGAGLGLATARRIAERHGGRIWAEAAEGGGTRILCRLPEAPG